jgi:hypothetical protein
MYVVQLQILASTEGMEVVQEVAGCALGQADTSGPFRGLPVEIQEAILLGLPATDLAPVESCSSYFRALVLEGDLWGRKACIVGRKALKEMKHEMDKTLKQEKDEVKDDDNDY